MIDLPATAEASRQRALRAYDVLDSPPEDAFDRITRLTRQIFGADMALINFLDRDRQWTKSCAGGDIEEIDRTDAFCNHTILADRVLVIEDARADDRFAENPFVIGDPNIRFYAGAPLVTPDNALIGALCVIDGEPRSFSAAQKEQLQDLAAIVVDQLELRREQQETVRQKDRRLAQQLRVLESATEGMAILNEDGEYIYVNNAHAKIFGYASGRALVGRSWHMLYDEAVIEDFTQKYLPQLREHGQWEGEVTARRKGGTPFELALHLTRLPGGGLICICRDITERKAQEGRLTAAQQQAEKADRLKASFLENMSHEIRTPITSILGFAEILADESSAADRHITDIIQASGRRLLDTLDAVLYLAQLESGSLELRPDTVDVAAEVEDIAHSFKERAENNGLFLNIEVAIGDPTACQDPEVIGRILRALLDNAVKFTRKGGVTVRARGEEAAITLEVQDTGVGFETPSEELFEAFQQESSGLQRAYEGSGLGLTIVKELVELSGGAIALESEKGRGTIVTVRLPRDVGDPETANGTLFSAHEWGLGRLPAHQAVLLVEDDPATRELIPHLLPESYTVEVARGVDEALEKARAEVYDVVFMDINLKDRIDGVELMRQMQEIDGYEATLFIAVTAYATPGDGERFHAEGFDGYVPKPFTKERLYRNLIQIQ